MNTTAVKMLPYNREGEIDYACLDFDPGAAKAEKPESMKQHKE